MDYSTMKTDAENSEIRKLHYVIIYIINYIINYIDVIRKLHQKYVNYILKYKTLIILFYSITAFYCLIVFKIKKKCRPLKKKKKKR